jgi:hypothetical protein
MSPQQEKPMLAKQFAKRIVLTTALLALVPVVQAATLQMSWSDPDKYRDIRATATNKHKFQAQVMAELEEQFHKEAEKLPADQILHVTVNDLDLAGEIEYFYTDYPFGLRVIRNVDFPQMEFNYELLDAAGKVLKSDVEKIADLGFRSSALVSANRLESGLHYEKKLIHEWYQQTFGTTAVASRQ